ncbi:MAG: hypothetical protein HOH04_05615 [Rhodospirillaceae bacterium]|jgi:hypothetical protein|nr:hypothetical protein [Rhodospirillaceae bacterium]
MRYLVRYDADDSKWLVIDSLSAGQTVGCHDQKPRALTQAKSEERLWHRFGAVDRVFHAACQMALGRRRMADPLADPSAEFT